MLKPKFSLIAYSSGCQKIPTMSFAFALSKSGYGTLKEIKDLDVFTYLGALVQMSIESIRQLAAAKLSTGQIAEKLNIPVSEILPHITENDDYEHTL